jgi:hypothetical protein
MPVNKRDWYEECIAAGAEVIHGPERSYEVISD